MLTFLRGKPGIIYVFNYPPLIRRLNKHQEVKEREDKEKTKRMR